MKTKILAIIPARGGSKGIPRKNVRLLAGKPLISYTIEASLRSRYINRTIVSTEDNEIASISKELGTEIIHRPEILASDTASTESVIEHVLEYLHEKENYYPDILVLLQPTSPLRNTRHIDEALDVIIHGKYDSLLSVCLSYTFIWKKKRDCAFPINYDFKHRPRRQDKENEYKENGAIYITTFDSFMNHKNRLWGKIGLYVMPEEYSIEIDTDLDFWLCEQIINNLEVKTNGIPF